jgi:hypothetical protein
MHVLVEVTAEDIEQGQPNDSRCCPIALALKRIYPDRTIRVGDEGFAEIGDGMAILPDEAYQFIGAFDEGRSVKPISFTLDDLTEGA